MAVAKHETRAPLYFIARKVFQRCQIQTTLPPSFLARVFKRVRDTHGRERSSSNPDGGWGKAKKAFVTRAGYPPHHPHPPLPMSDTGGALTDLSSVLAGMKTRGKKMREREGFPYPRLVPPQLFVISPLFVLSVGNRGNLCLSVRNFTKYKENGHKNWPTNLEDSFLLNFPSG